MRWTKWFLWFTLGFFTVSYLNEPFIRSDILILLILSIKLTRSFFLSYHWLFYRHQYTLWSMLNDLVRWKNRRVRLAEVIFNHVSLICCWCFGSRTWQFPYDVFLRHLRAICIAHIRFSKGNIRCCLPGIYNKLISTAVALFTKLLDIDFIIIIRR